ncbi:MAG: hypothetical protein WC967_09335 [Balneolaceae bacterium]
MTTTRKEVIRELAMIGKASAYYYKMISGNTYLTEVISTAENECEITVSRIYYYQEMLPVLSKQFEKTKQYALALAQELGVKKPHADKMLISPLPYILRALIRSPKSNAYQVGCDVIGKIKRPISEVESALSVFNWKKAA